MLPLFFAAITITWNFEGGSLAKADSISSGHFRLSVAGQADKDGRNRQASWYFFRIDGAAGVPLTLDLTNLVGEYNYKPGTHPVSRNTRPVVSEDGRTWRHMNSTEWNEAAKELRVRLTPQSNRIWVAHVPPYTQRDLDAALRRHRGNPRLARETVGKTVRRRDIPLLTISSPGARKTVWLMVRHHAWETGTSWMLDGALDALLAQPGRVTWKIFPIGDPDGVALGGVRFNQNGYDLNRNWDTIDPGLMPEIAAQHRAMMRWLDSGRSIDFFLTLHNTESADYLEGPLTGGGEAVRAMAAGVVSTLEGAGLFHSPRGPRDAADTTTAGMKGRRTVNQQLFAERGVPAFLMETMVEPHPKLGRNRTVEDWRRLGAALFRAIEDQVAAR